jgi:hypothetical protein
LTDEDRIISKCWAITVADQRRNKASVAQNEGEFNKWDKATKKALGELIRIIQDSWTGSKGS